MVTARAQLWLADGSAGAGDGTCEGTIPAIQGSSPAGAVCRISKLELASIPAASVASLGATVRHRMIPVLRVATAGVVRLHRCELLPPVALWVE